MNGERDWRLDRELLGDWENVTVWHDDGDECTGPDCGNPAHIPAITTPPPTSEHGINVRRLEQALVGCGYFQDDDAETAAPSVAKLYDESRALDIRRLHFDQGIEETHERFEECGNPKCVWARRVLNESNGWRGMFQS